MSEIIANFFFQVDFKKLYIRAEFQNDILFCSAPKKN